MNRPGLDFEHILLEWNRTPAEGRAEFEKRVKEMPYTKFLETPYWQAIRAEVHRLRGAKCEECKTGFGRLEVHHRSYQHHGLEHLYLDDLLILCERCHMLHHIPETLERLQKRTMESEKIETRARVNKALTEQSRRYFKARRIG